MTLWKDFKRKPVKTPFEQYICVIKGAEVFKMASPIYRKNIYVGTFEHLKYDETPVDFFNSHHNRQYPLATQVNF